MARGKGKGASKPIATPFGFQKGGNSGVGMGLDTAGKGNAGKKSGTKKKSGVAPKMGPAPSKKLGGPTGFLRKGGRGK